MPELGTRPIAEHPLNVRSPLLGRIMELLAVRMGLDFQKARERDLERGIQAVAKEFGFKDPDSCMAWLLSAPLTREQVEALASRLTVGETYFFRDKRCFEALEQNILPELLRVRRDSGRHLRIWSAGCATGEEPYSLAMLLSGLLPDMADWNITILGTDINPHFLKKADEGIYSDWSFRDSPPALKARYFSKIKEGAFEVLPRIKKMVAYSYHNLAEDAYPSLQNNTNAMDIIFCRNVLMYFNSESAHEAVRKLRRCLVDGGWLIVSPVETSSALFSEFTAVNFPGAIMYRKDVQSTEYGVRSLTTKTEITFTLPVPLPSREGQHPLPSVGEGRGEGGFSGELEKGIVMDAYQEALSFFERGRYADAAEKALAVTQEERSAPAMSLLARSYANMGRLADAQAWCEQAILSDKTDPEFHYLHAVILQEQGRGAEAAVSLKRAIYLDPEFALAYFALGNLARQQGNAKESKKHFENALSLLASYRQEDIPPQSDGMSAGRLTEIIKTTLQTEGA